MSDELDHINPLLRTAVESVTRAMAEAFDELWTKPDAPRVMEGFLADRISFVIRRGGVLVVERVPGDDAPGGDRPGQYL